MPRPTPLDEPPPRTPRWAYDRARAKPPAAPDATAAAPSGLFEPFPPDPGAAPRRKGGTPKRGPVFAAITQGRKR
jgi:hypothetical protein